MPALAVMFAVSGCAGFIPRTGPTKGEVFNSSVQRSGETYVVVANQGIARAASFSAPLGFPAVFRNQPVMNSDAIQPGDTLSLTIWENVQEGLLETGGVPAPLQRIQVDSDGMIFVPYAGRVRAAGMSPEQLRGELSRKLGDKTPDPQVLVARGEGDGASVSVSGKVTKQGVYPIQRPTRRLSAMLARAGGVNIETEIAQVTVVRAGSRGKVWYDSLFEAPVNDIALRSGDRILVEADERYFTALGATGSQTRVRFDSQELSAMEALAQVGGLSTVTADPTGIFLLRDEPESVARNVLGLPNLAGPQKIAYIFNLTEGAGLFVARSFNIRDEDTIYVTEAPISQFNKAISAVFGSLTTVASIQTVAPQ